MSDDRAPGHDRPSRRTFSRGLAWTVPTIVAATAAPAYAGSGQVCQTGNVSGVGTSSWNVVVGPTQADGNGRLWMRFDHTLTYTVTWAPGTVTSLQHVCPFMYSGPVANGSSGPWHACVWDDATGMWASTDAAHGTVGRRSRISQYQSSTPGTRVLYQTYLDMPMFPIGTTTTGPSSNPQSIATIAPTDSVYVIDLVPMPVSVGQAAVGRFSHWVEMEADNRSRMQTATWGYMMGTVCYPSNA